MYLFLPTLEHATSMALYHSRQSVTLFDTVYTTRDVNRRANTALVLRTRGRACDLEPPRAGWFGAVSPAI